MDDIVKQAMFKWPNVPDCYGWLGLDARGNWYMRDDRVQAIGPFDSGRPHVKGSRLQHEKLIEFIGRNYDADGHGNWFFQNGPQRVYVELEATPWIWRMADDYLVTSHTGVPTKLVTCMQDENGWVYLQTEKGFGLLHTQDVGCVAHGLEQGQWPLVNVASADLPNRFNYVRSPQKNSQR